MCHMCSAQAIFSLRKTRSRSWNPTAVQRWLLTADFFYVHLELAPQQNAAQMRIHSSDLAGMFFDKCNASASWRLMHILYK